MPSKSMILFARQLISSLFNIATNFVMKAEDLLISVDLCYRAVDFALSADGHEHRQARVYRTFVAAIYLSLLPQHLRS